MQTNDTTITTAEDNNVIDGAITEVKAPDPAQAVLNPEQFAIELFEPFHAELTSAKRKASRANYDITTPAGMQAAKLLSDTFTKIRTRADKVKTEYKKPIDQAGKAILTRFNALADLAKAEQDKHDQAIAAEKARVARIEEEKRNAERARIEAIENRLAFIRGIPGQLAKANAETLAAKIEELLAKQLDPALYDEFLEQAAQAMIDTTEGLRQLHADAVRREAEAAELERLRTEDARRKAEADALRKQQEEAAAALKSQQDQMAAIMEMQGLAGQLKASGTDTDRAIVEAALGKARAFDPATFGAMAPMATMARDIALPALEAMLASLPEPKLLVVDGAELQPATIAVDIAAPGADETVRVDVEVGEDEALKVTHISRGSSAPAVAVPVPKRPTELDLIQLVAREYNVPNAVAYSWLASFNAEAARAAFAEQA